MFEDRTKYDFNKIDSVARTKVLTEKKPEQMTEAQKKLFSVKEAEKTTTPILNKHNDISVDNLPSSKYLQSFSQNLTVGEAEKIDVNLSKVEQEVVENIEELNTKTENEINFENLLDQSTDVKIDAKIINKELKSITPANKKNYSFRIKLVTGVYCILVALFGGWVIGNAVDIAQTNAKIYETISSTKDVQAEIGKIVLKIKNFDDASQNPDDNTILKDIIIQSIETTPKEVVAPNEYTVQSNWFDAICNWISRLFGGK